MFVFDAILLSIEQLRNPLLKYKIRTASSYVPGILSGLVGKTLF